MDSGHSGQVDKLKINMEMNQEMYLTEHFSLREMTATNLKRSSMTFTAPPIRVTLYIGAVHLLVIYSSLLDGKAALVVLNVLLEAGNVLGSRSDADASVACKDNLLEIISQR